MMLCRYTTAAFTAAGMLSLNGRCKTLDAAADGHARAEGCETLAMVVRTERHSVGSAVLVAGSNVNQDGRSSSLTAPNGPAQQIAIAAALQQSRIAGGTVRSVWA